MYISVQDVAKRYGVTPSTIWRWRNERVDFPQPHRFGPQTLRWKIAELDAWDEQQVPA